jgi:hypothetical protein
MGVHFNGSEPFIGQIDEVQVFSRALTLAEIREIYLAGAAGKCTGTVQVKKDITGPPSDDTFHLQIDGYTHIVGPAGDIEANDGQETPKIRLAPGQHVVSEEDGATAEDDWETSIGCDNGAGSETTSVNVNVNAGDDIVCLITNASPVPDLGQPPECAAMTFDNVVHIAPNQSFTRRTFSRDLVFMDEVTVPGRGGPVVQAGSTYRNLTDAPSCVVGSRGRDTMIASGVLLGRAGNDVLQGRGTPDYLDGGTTPGALVESDSLWGGAGTDTCKNGEANSLCEQ